MKNRFTLLLLGLILLNIFTVEAQQITSNGAMEKARNFLGNPSTAQRARGIKAASEPQMKLAYVGGDFINPDFYIYNVGENEGFVIVSADERTNTILGYATEGSFNLQTASDGFMTMLDGYSGQIRQLRASKAEVELPVLVKRKAEAQTLADITKIALMDSVSMTVTGTDGTVKTMTGIKYDQYGPYNKFCPMTNTGRTLTGCSATAMVQVMRYHSWPDTGTGSHKNISFANDSTIDFGKTQYSWNLMMPTYYGKEGSVTYGKNENREAVALIMHHAGVAINTIYSSNGSGSGPFAVTSALVKYFKYNTNLDLANRIIYSDDEWFQLMKNEVDNGRPVIYSGTSKTGGHMFVCDGYDSEGRLHYNYGWSGTGNAYLFPTILEDGSGVNKYMWNNDAIIGVSPNSLFVRPQIAQLSVMGVNKTSLTAGTPFNASFRVTNYGQRQYKNGVRLALCDPTTGDVVQYLKNSANAQEITIQVPLNNWQMDPGAVRYQNVLFTGMKIPAAVKDGTYNLRSYAAVAETNGAAMYPMLAKDGDVQRNIKVVKAGNAITFSYDLAAGQRELNLVPDTKKLSVAFGVGKANFQVVNPNSRYAFTGKLFLIGFKDETGTMELFGTQEDLYIKAKDTLKVDFSGLRMNSGNYKFYLAYNPVDNAKGSWLGAVPIPGSEISLTIEDEKSFYDKNLNKLTALPDTYRQFNDDKEFILPPDADLALKQEAPWMYGVMGRKAWSILTPNNKAIASHTMVTDPISVNDMNAVLEWTLVLMGSYDNTPHLLYVYVSDKGNDVENFTEENCLRKDSMLITSGDLIFRESLYQYAGKKVYIAFKHVRLSGDSIYDDVLSGLEMKRIRVLTIKSPKDIELEKIEVEERAVIGDTLPIKVTLRNLAPIPVTKVTAVYSVNGGTEFRDTLTSKGLAYDLPASYTLNKAKVTGLPGDELNVSVTLVMEGEDGDLLGNNTKTAKVTAMKYHPRKSMMVYKVSRGGCGACSYSYAHLDAMEENYPSNFAGIEIWEPYNNQPTYPEYGCEDFKSFYNSTTPAITMNNKNVWISDIGQIEVNAVNQCMASKPVSEIKVQANYIDEQSRTIQVKLTSNFAVPLTGTYKMGIFVIESNVLANNFQILGASLVKGGHTKNHMPIAAPQGAKGENSTYTIINPKEGVDYTYEFTYDVPERHGNEGGNRAVNKDNIQVIGLMFNPNGTIDCSALNSFYVRIPARNGLTFVSEDGYDPFKSILEVKDTVSTSIVYVSARINRATVLTGNDFRFRMVKDASIGTRKVRLMIRKTRESAAEPLVPDANGVYTLENVDRYYYIDSEVLNVEEPTYTREGTGLVLKGSWDGVDFRRINPAEASVTSIDMTGITIPVDAPQITPLNPNCLIYVAKGAVVPASWKNVVIGDEAEAINLTDGNSFYNIKPFTASTITYTRDYPQIGWSSLCLPFAVTEIPDGIELKKYTACTGTEVRFSVFSEASTVANMPYMAEIKSDGKKVFTAQNVMVEASSTNRDIKHDNGDFVFKGTFTPYGKGEATGLFILHSDGTGFLKAGEKTTIPAFRAYLNNEGKDNTILCVRVNLEEPTGMESGQAEGKFRVYTTGGILVIVAEQSMQMNLLTVDGQILRRMELNSGENVIDDLMPGFYLVGNKKVCIQ